MHQVFVRSTQLIDTTSVQAVRVRVGEKGAHKLNGSTMKF